MKQDCSSSSGAIRVQVWSTKQAAPAVAVDMRANVCCVKYNPGSAHEIAVGSADHSVHLYDLRNVASPVHVFAGAAGLWILAVSNSPAPGSSLGLLTVFCGGAPHRHMAHGTSDSVLISCHLKSLGGGPYQPFFVA